MDEQTQRSSHKLAWRWLTNVEALLAVRHGAFEMEALRAGHALLSREQFQEALIGTELEVLALPNNCAALIAWGECADGRVLNILTTVGSERHADLALMCIEAAAKERGAKVVMSVGRRGWSALAKRHSYIVNDCILMRKNLDANPVS